MPRREIFVGNLHRAVNRRDIEDVFEKYGRLNRCDLKNRGAGTAYCFVEFDEERDAEDALRAEHGKDLLGNAMVVEWAKSKGDRRERRAAPRSLECYECGERGHFARDCRSRRGGGGGGRDRRDSRERRRSDSRDRDRERRRSRSRSRDRRDSRERRRSRSGSRGSGYRGKSTSRGRSASPRSKSRSPTCD